MLHSLVFVVCKILVGQFSVFLPYSCRIGVHETHKSENFYTILSYKCHAGVTDGGRGCRAIFTQFLEWAVSCMVSY